MAAKSPTSAPKSAAETAYCMTCKDKVEMLDGKNETLKNGRPAKRGKCAEGHVVFKILPSAKK